MKKGWKRFDFGPSIKKDEVIKSQEEVKIVDNPRKVAKPGVINKKTFNFDAKIAPRKVEELAVHPKKIKEVKTWLETNNTQKQNASFLLVSGPTGSGKTATINVLCNAMGINISEWVNPIDQDFEITRGPSQVTRFLEFLTESKYASLFDEPGGNKIAVVKDFPNAVIHNPNEFFNILEDCYYQARCPIVFICTDASNSSLNLAHTLFPQEIKDKYNVNQIVFNACASTLMKTALKRAMNVIQDNPDLFKAVSGQTIDAILASCMGDIRSAMNQLHLASLIGSYDLPTEQNKVSTKRKRGEKSTKVKNMLRDETLGIFHGLGRVLNPKKIEVDGCLRVNCDFDKLIDEFSTQPGMFTAFLFENYIQYFGDVDDASKAADILSTSQIFLEKWLDRHETLVFALWVSVMGLMIYNEHKISKWTQIRGPTKVNKQQLQKEVRRLSPIDCYYYNLINKSDEVHVFNCE